MVLMDSVVSNSLYGTTAIILLSLVTALGVKKIRMHCKMLILYNTLYWGWFLSAQRKLLLPRSWESNSQSWVLGDLHTVSSYIAFSVDRVGFLQKRAFYHADRFPLEFDSKQICNNDIKKPQITRHFYPNQVHGAR